jgi:hypothetical protein
MPLRQPEVQRTRSGNILDTSAWNALFDDEKRVDLVRIIRKKIHPPNIHRHNRIGGNRDSSRRRAILQLVKTVGRDHRPLATPNEIIVMACQGYARRDAKITLNTGSDAEGGWIALNKPISSMKRLSA